jgi:hypothetical protein
MSENDYSQQQAPNPDLRTLDRLVGTWDITGGVTGQVRYEWMEGGFFLLQHVDLHSGSGHVKGLEVIGHERRWGEASSEEIKSRYYGSMGETFDYVYEMEGDTLTIWSGGKGSPAYYRGTLNADGTEMHGAWVYPGGGGYESNMTRRS